MLKDCRPEDLKGRFNQWNSWFGESVPYLRADPKEPYWTLDSGAKKQRLPINEGELPPLHNLPTLPLPDWADGNPPSPELLVYLL